MLVERRPADDDRLAEARLQLGLSQPLAIGAKVEELERIRRAHVRRLLLEAPRVGEVGDPLARRHREVVTALTADTKRFPELLVAVVGAAGRAGVGMPRAVRRRRLILPLDGDVDAAFDHQIAHYRPAFRASTRAAAWRTRSRNAAERRASASRCR